MTQPADPTTRIADNISDLIDPYTSTQHYEAHGIQRTHRMRHPPLILQLAAAAELTTGADGHRTPGSKPAARLDAIDLLATIRYVTRAELDSVGIIHTRQLTADLRRLVGAPWTRPQAHTIAKLTARWVTAARIITAWESAPYRPNARCPVCDTRGTLRVRLYERTALCVECRSMWEPSGIPIEVLANIIIEANGERTPA